MSRLQFLIAWRYFRSGKKASFVNIIAGISIVAIAVGTCALIVILSVFNGFKGLVDGLYTDFYSDLTIHPSTGQYLQLSSSQLDRIRHLSGVVAISPVIEEKAVLANGNSQVITAVRGVDSSYKLVNGLFRHLVRGRSLLGDAQDPRLIVGAGIEDAAQIDVEDSLVKQLLYVPIRGAAAQMSVTSLESALNSADVRVSGTFMIQQDFDDKYSFTNIDFMRYMLDLDSTTFSSVEIRIRKGMATSVSAQIDKMLGPSFKTLTRLQQNQSLFTVMNMEKWIIFIILAIILFVSSFNMVGALSMLVLNKSRDIAILKALGCNRSGIRGIFLFNGLFLGLMGALSGGVIALLLCFLQQQFHFIKLNGGSFIIDYYPVKFLWSDFLIVFLTVILIALSASWFPAKKAASQEFSLKS